MIRGIDVSAAQGSVDWENLVRKWQIQFAYLKCSEGNQGTDPLFDTPSFSVDAARASKVTARDPQFSENMFAAAKAGILTGAYHFAYPLPPGAAPMRDPANQAKFAFDCAGGLGQLEGELPPALDLEWPEAKDWPKWGCSKTQICDWALTYLDAARTLWGCSPVLYVSPGFAASLDLRQDARFATVPLWLADYPAGASTWPREAPTGLTPEPWHAWTFWQWTGGGIDLPDTHVKADCDLFAGTLDELKALARAKT
jgi:lysozyme